MSVDPTARGLAAKALSGQTTLFSQTTTGTAGGTGAGIGRRNGLVGSDDTAIGYHALTSYTTDAQSYQTALGAYTLGNATAGAGSTAVGQKALTNATTAQQSVAVGSKAGTTLTDTEQDTFVGYAAAQFSNATNVGRRVFVGYNAGQYDSGDYNINIGYNSGPQALQSTGIRNIIVGADSGKVLNGATDVILIGYGAGPALTTGSKTIAIGYQAGSGITNSQGNILIGYQAGFSINGQHNIFIGEGAGGTAPSATTNTFIAGSSSSGGGSRIDDVYFGKGMLDTSPTAYTIHGTGGSGADQAGADLNLAGGKGTGTGAGGALRLQVAPAAGSTGSTANALADAVVISSDKWVKAQANLSAFPASSVTPTTNGEMTFQLTSNTTLVIKVKGSDGTVRSTTLTLA